MKVGDYVRNKYGIAKVIDIEKGKDILNGIDIDVLVFDNDICFLANKETGERKEDTPLFNKLPITKDIDLRKIKSSPNIIDLIEVGDYVNDEKIVSIGLLTNGPEKGTKTIDYYIAPNTLYYFKNEDIKSIVTKEQFEAMQYNLESGVK